MVPHRKNPPVKSLWSLAGLGMEFTGILMFFLFGGSWLDERFAMEPVLLMTGAFLGFALGVYHIIRRSGGGTSDASN